MQFVYEIILVITKRPTRCHSAKQVHFSDDRDCVNIFNIFSVVRFVKTTPVLKDNFFCHLKIKTFIKAVMIFSAYAI